MLWAYNWPVSEALTSSPAEIDNQFNGFAMKPRQNVGVHIWEGFYPGLPDKSACGTSTLPDVYIKVNLGNGAGAFEWFRTDERTNEMYPVWNKGETRVLE